MHLPAGVLRSEAPIIADGRMQPHEWLLTESGRVLKLDGAEHGDDHFFPGPTDIAWDLAGAIVEWQMDAETQQAFLRAYRRASGDDAEQRVTSYLLAYTSFRMGYCKMAAEAMQGSEEEHRLLAAYARYREQLALLVHAMPEKSTVTSAAASGGAHADETLSVGMPDGASAEPMAA
jgi:hypothetical protein